MGCIKLNIAEENRGVLKVVHRGDLGLKNNCGRYYPFGMQWDTPKFDFNDNSLEPTGAKTKYTYNGNEVIEDLGLDLMDFNARWYDPAVGRFLQVDPLSDHSEQVSKSVFAYSWNNPILLNDPNGECPTCIIGGIIGGAVGAGVSIFKQVRSGNGIDGSKVLAATAGGAVSGAIVGSGVGLIAAAGGALTGGGAVVAGTTGVVAGAAGGLTTQSIEVASGDRIEIDAEEIAIDAVLSGPANMIGAGVGQAVKGVVVDATRAAVTTANVVLTEGAEQAGKSAVSSTTVDASINAVSKAIKSEINDDATKEN